MRRRWNPIAALGILGSVLLVGDVIAQTTVNYGLITAVRQVDLQNQGAQTAGTLIGGLAGVASGSGQSRSNRALRGVGGAAVGRGIGGAMGSSTGFEYTVLVRGTNTTQIVTEQAGLRVGDCVSVEQGAFNNIRLVPEERCGTATASVAQTDAQAADACLAAKDQLLAAQTDQEFDRAERRMRLLCE